LARGTFVIGACDSPNFLKIGVNLGVEDGTDETDDEKGEGVDEKGETDG